MKKFLRNVWRLATPYFNSEEKWSARGLLLLIICLKLGIVFMSVQINEWNNDFYNTLQDFNKSAFVHAIYKFTWLAVIFIILGVYSQYFNQMLQIRWRRWLTRSYLRAWLSDQTYYQMQLAGAQSADNPDQRIAEDINQFIDLTLNVSLDMFNSLVTLFSFLFILWTLSGPFAMLVHGYHLYIPGYLVWTALLYAFFGTLITLKLGRPLIRLSFNQQRFEADFRYSLVRLRENTESVAFYHGEVQEKAGFLTRFLRIFDNYYSIMKRQKLLGWFTNFYGQAAIIFPFIVTAPRFFARQIKLGAMMQTASAFGQVQTALSYIINSYGSLATWKAVVDRIAGFIDATQNASGIARHTALVRTIVPSGGMTLENATISLPNGILLLENLSLSIAPGRAVQIKGPSGCGKSTVLRVLAGLWPYATGHLTTCPESKILFVPQKPYAPLGTLRTSLYYPTVADTSHDDVLVDMLALAGLGQFVPQLDEERPWSHILSPGEQQRLAFARAFLQKPDILLLDEATSALDEETEQYLYGLLKERLPNTALVSVAHRSTLARWHDHELDLSAYRPSSRASV